MSGANTVKPAALRLPAHREPYYAGKWQKPKADRYIDAVSPGTGESLGKVVDGSAADAEAAIAAGGFRSRAAPDPFVSRLRLGLRLPEVGVTGFGYIVGGAPALKMIAQPPGRVCQPPMCDISTRGRSRVWAPRTSE